MSKYGKYIQIPANILLLLAILIFGIALFGERADGEAYIGKFDTWTFNENWRVQENDGYSEITLPTVLQNKKGTTITLENLLPSYVDDGMRLCMRTNLQDICIYIDGKLRGSYAGENLKYVGEYLPSAYVMVDLKEEDAGKPICVEITVKVQGRLSGVSIGYGNNAWFAVLYQNIPVAIAALVLTIVGILAVASYFVMRKLMSSSRAVLFLGQTMIATGMWIISESNIRQLIFRSPSYSAFFSYLFIELIGGFVVLYFNEIQKYKYNRIYIVFETLIFGQAVVNTFLELSGLAEFYETLIFSHIWMLAGIIVFLITFVIDIKTGQSRKYAVTAWGMFLFILFCSLELLEFYSKDFYILGMYLCVGLIVLLAATVIQTIRDEMEKVRMTVELEREKEEAEEANRLKSQFLTRMSHEMRTPVNAILGMNEMILRESSDEDAVRSYAQDVKNSSLSLLTLINEILDSSKIESGMMEIVNVNYEIGSLLNDIYGMISIRAEEKNLKLTFDINPGIPCEYCGDDKRIKQVLINLLTNAVKYTDRGEVTLRVTCDGNGENAILHYSVKDTGIGIRKEDIGKIANAFQRLDVEKNRNVEGTGLGMSIVQQLLKLMGSELRIESEYEKGSEFSFDIVQKIVNPEPLGDFRERIRRAKETGTVSAGFTAPEAKILVVDDNAMNLKVFKNLLKQTQMQVFGAGSGKECLDILRQQSFDLIFLDHMMPEMDGIETLHAMQNDKLCEGVPVIMLTANAMIGNQEKYSGAGFDDFLSKPIIPEQLDKMILRHLPERFIVTVDSAGGAGQIPGEESNRQERPFDRLRKKLPEINFEIGLATSSGDEAFYLELLQDFTEMPIKEELAKCLEKMDHKNYCVRIHGFKSSAYSIGAKTIGDLAFEMEKLSREGLPGELEALQKQLFEQYDRICRQYSLFCGQSFHS